MKSGLSILRGWLLAAALAIASPVQGEEAAPDRRVTGGVFTYEVRSGDSLTSIGARFGLDVRVLARENGLDLSRRLQPGDMLLVDNQHIIPGGYDDALIINVPQRMLFHFHERQLMAAYPVTVGRPDWPTPIAGFTVTTLEQDKTWFVPKSIQAEMLAEGKEVKTRVPPGPNNPLGRHWIGLSLPGYGIHGTPFKSSIYHFQSHGCIRLHPDDIEALFNSVEIGLTGRFIYQSVLLAKLADGGVMLEVHPDAYKNGIDARKVARELAAAEGVSDQIDWILADRVIAAQEGVARSVVRQP